MKKKGVVFIERELDLTTSKTIQKRFCIKVREACPLDLEKMLANAPAPQETPSQGFTSDFSTSPG